MNKEKLKLYLNNIIACAEEEVDYTAYCPICEGFASVSQKDQGLPYEVMLECTNPKCIMKEYTIKIP